jgi:CheY-like chemotaxis protein
MTSKAPILVVDDDPGIRALVAASLEFEGHSVLTAADGSVALGVVARIKPALILLDQSMPKLDGPGFARELRDRGFEIPIIVVSGSIDAKAFAQDIDAEALIRKPFNVPHLLDTVEDCMTRRMECDDSIDSPVAGT